MTNRWKIAIITTMLLTGSYVAATVVDGANNQVAAAAPTVAVDKSSVNHRQTIIVTGTYTANEWVTLRAIDSNGDLIVFDGVKSDAAGAYTFEVSIPDHAAAGVMDIYTGAGEEVAHTSVQVTVRSGGSNGGSSGSSGSGTPAVSDTAGPQADSSGMLVYEVEISDNADGRSEATVTVDGDAIQQAVEHNPSTVTIKVDADAELIDVRLAGEALQQLIASEQVEIVNVVTPLGTYELPMAVVDRELLAAELGVDAEDITLRIVIHQASDMQHDTASEAAEEIGADVVAAFVDFHVEAVTEEGEAMEVLFGSTYVSRTLPLPSQVDTDRATAVRYDEAADKLVFVPALFYGEGDNWYAELKRTGNSLYTVIEHSQSFADIPDSHWGKDEIELLASKLIVSGVSDDTFAPAQTLTRAEFAALIVRGLGLEEQGASSFTDVRAIAWYAGAVGAAYEAGLVAGYEDGSFRPNEPITRQELAKLIHNALVFTGQAPADAGGESVAFTDRDAIADWAQAAVASIAEAGITEGRSVNRFEPTALSNRAEAAAMIKRLLQHVRFID